MSAIGAVRGVAARGAIAAAIGAGTYALVAHGRDLNPPQDGITRRELPQVLAIAGVGMVVGGVLGSLGHMNPVRPASGVIARQAATGALMGTAMLGGYATGIFASQTYPK